MASLMEKDRNLGKLWEMMRDREVWHDTVCGVTKSQEIDWVTKQQQFPKSVFLFFFFLIRITFLKFAFQEMALGS